MKLSKFSEFSNSLLLKQLTFKDIHGLVEQNAQLRNLVRKLSDEEEIRDAELRVKLFCYVWITISSVECMQCSMVSGNSNSFPWISLFICAFHMAFRVIFNCSSRRLLMKQLLELKLY